MTTITQQEPHVTKPAENETKEENQSIVKTLQHDASEAAWRTAGSQFVRLTREPLVALLCRHLGPNDEALRGKLAEFLTTDVGTALLASLLSVGLAAIPGIAGEVPQRLSRELRIRAMSDGADVVAEVLAGPLRTVIATYLQDVQPVLESKPAPALGPSPPRFPRPVESAEKAKSEIG